MVKMEKLTLDLLKNSLGQPHKKIGCEYVWQCPYCQDTHKDNLKFNETKGILKCFANDRHAAEILRDINKQNHSKYPVNNSKPIKTIVQAENKLTSEELANNLFYQIECTETLKNEDKALNELLNKRGITKETAELVGIGIDKEIHCWVFPIWKYSVSDTTSEILGFEYRPPLLPNAIKSKRTKEQIKAKEGIRRKKGSISGLAMINAKTPYNKILAIVEGFLDGYALYQYLKEREQLEYYHIITPSNGIGVLKKQMSSIDFSKYADVYLYADNDDRAKQIIDEIIEQYPFIKVVKQDCCKDFNEHYLKCIKGTK